MYSTNTYTRQPRQPLAQRYQTRFDCPDRALVSIFNSLQGADPSFRKAVESVQTNLDDLVEHAYQLSLRSIIIMPSKRSPIISMSILPRHRKASRIPPMQPRARNLKRRSSHRKREKLSLRM